MTNCINCGAPLNGQVCAYCGTKYSGSGICATFSENDYTGTITIGGNTFEVYLAREEIDQIGGMGAGRDMFGRMHTDFIRRLHKFELIEL